MKLIFTLTLTILNSLSSTGQGEASFSCMTYNIRYDNVKDTPKWDQRKRHVIGLIQFHRADVLGVQEALHHQLIDMEDGMPGYKWVGKGRDDGHHKGEFSAIFYKTDLFDLLESKSFWLSTTPDRPSRSWDAALPRICTWAKLNHKFTNVTFYVFNTHFDHKGEEARLQSSRLIVDKVYEIAGESPFVLLGDFNFSPESKPYEVILNESQLFDAQKISAQVPYGASGTFNGFQFHQPIHEKIDHIFVGPNIKVVRHGILSDSFNMNYPSDHFPVIAELEFIGEKVTTYGKWSQELSSFDQQDYKKGIILFTGSSSIRLWPDLNKSFSSKFIINRGFGGSEIRDLYLHAERIIFRYAAKQVVIYSGDNDIWNGKSAEVVFQNFKELFLLIRERLPLTETIYISIKPSPSRIGKLEEMAKANRLIETYLDTQKRGVYVDIFHPMLGEDGKPLKKFFLEDMLHLNEDGYKLWTQILRPYLKDYSSPLD